MSHKTYRYEVTYIDKTGAEVIKIVRARHEFEAIQLAGAFGQHVIRVVNLDI